MEEEKVLIELPDPEETQIWDAPNDEREISLYLETKKGKVSGDQFTPFIMPQRWTYETLLTCIRDYISRAMTGGDVEAVEVKRLYYKKSGQSKTIVAVQGDQDIPAMLSEYPLTWPGSGRKRKATIIMAVDWSRKIDDNGGISDASPRRSPRVSAAKQRLVQDQECEAFVYHLEKGKSNDKKLSNTSAVLHGIVPDQLNLCDLKNLLKTMDSGSSNSRVFVPSNGLFWIRKGNKQLVALETDNDLKSCFKEYKDSKGHVKAIRIACAAVSTNNSATSTGSCDSLSRKRSLDFSSEAESTVKQTSKPKTDNDLWNSVYCSLVRDLEKKGSKDRFGVKHLKLWTDEILEGRSSGVGEEPIWQNFISEVGVPPKPARSSPQSSFSPQATSTPTSTLTTDDLLKAMFVQNQQRMDIEAKRAEVFQNTMMAMMTASSPLFQQKMSGSFSTPTTPTTSKMTDPTEMYKKQLLNYSQDDCLSLLRKAGLQHLEHHFLRAEVDGSLLVCLNNPHINYSIFEGLGIHEPRDKEAVIDAVNGEMSVSTSGCLDKSFA